MAATCGWTSTELRPITPRFANRRQNWWRSRPTSSLPMVPQPWGRCCRRHARCHHFPNHRRSSWRRLRRQSGATGWQRHRLHDFRIQSPTGMASFGVIQAMAPSLKVEVTPVNMPNAGEIERVVTAFAQSPNGGLIVTASGAALVNRDLIIALAARHKLPAVYFERSFVAAGGLVSYGADFNALYRKAAGYVDRILKGDKPADLPVQTPTKYETVINLKTAKALGLTVPQAWLTTTDEVIE